MLPWIHLDTAAIPNGGGELRLMQRGRDFSIMLGRIELMSSRQSGSEEALARLTCARLQTKAPHILIGGLGMGFTLRAALAELGDAAEVSVAELVPAVIAWARGPMADLFGGCLADPRVHLHEGDVGSLIGSARASYDAILLDVDNGPDGLTHPQNDGLYSAAGLAAALGALRRDGVLAIWSSAPDDAFSRRLRQGGFAVEEVRVRARAGGGGARHVIWLATKGAQGRAGSGPPREATTARGKRA